MTIKQSLAVAFLCISVSACQNDNEKSTEAKAKYPEKPISFVVPFPPGDLEDVLTRMIAEDVQKEYGQAAAVINKPGGGGGPFPGAAEVAKAAPDGYTIGSFVVDVPTVGPHVGIPELNPNPFEPLGSFLTYPFVIVTSKSSPYKDITALAEYAKENPVILGHFGDPLPPTRVTKALASKMGFKFSSNAAFDALDCNTIASGDVDVMNTTIQQILPCLDKMTVLATLTENRLENIPDVPTVGELQPELKMVLWNGLFVHKNTPQEARDKIIAVAKKTVAGEKAQKLAKDTGAQIYWQDAEATKARIDIDIQTIGKIDKILGE